MSKSMGLNRTAKINVTKQDSQISMGLNRIV
jgi:hypothetical protein